MTSKLFFACDEMVCVPTGMKVYTNIVFNPKKDADRDIRAAEALGGYFDITVSDGGGEHTTEKPHRIMSVMRVRNVLTYTSKEM